MSKAKGIRPVGFFDCPGGGQVVVESTKDGLLLRAGVTFPIEIYSEARMAEFAKNDAALAPFAARIKTATRRKAKNK